MPELHDSAVRASLEARLKSLTPSSPRRWGTMSADQMLWHVNQALLMALGEGDFKPHKPPMPRALLRFFVLNLPWPKSAPTHPQCVASGGHDFEAERAQCLALIGRVAQRPIGGSWPESPSFGPVTGRFVSRLQAKHLDHHFKQFSA
jgi:hypothetical protein